ncbi:hypothetical protein GCM10007939_19400 [Amylibacter marinus]|uniref:DUF4177 domain-containing protein n=1 Tax=Amylibacter marinus TaxID=1475483 RepID=A0ABQ5VWT5_9RHOB|nr:hypothetical protein [Amylibacter marinus]GLQ35657.1 hypothetical protein GCM10007939_19400 [Amylibacter marinus]
MKHGLKKLRLGALALALMATQAQADCYADYKAKASSDDLRLHYGVVKISGGDCASVGDATSMVQSRIGGDGWQVLRIMSTFDDSGLAQRKANAGKFFLRY